MKVYYKETDGDMNPHYKILFGVVTLNFINGCYMYKCSSDIVRFDHLIKPPNIKTEEESYIYVQKLKDNYEGLL